MSCPSEIGPAIDQTPYLHETSFTYATGPPPGPDPMTTYSYSAFCAVADATNNAKVTTFEIILTKMRFQLVVVSSVLCDNVVAAVPSTPPGSQLL